MDNKELIRGQKYAYPPRSDYIPYQDVPGPRLHEFRPKPRVPQKPANFDKRFGENPFQKLSFKKEPLYVRYPRSSVLVLWGITFGPALGIWFHKNYIDEAAFTEEERIKTKIIEEHFAEKFWFFHPSKWFSK